MLGPQLCATTPGFVCSVSLSVNCLATSFVYLPNWVFIHYWSIEIFYRLNTLILHSQKIVFTSARCLIFYLRMPSDWQVFFLYYCLSKGLSCQDKRQPGEERVYLNFCFHNTVHHEGKSIQELTPETWQEMKQGLWRIKVCCIVLCDLHITFSYTSRNISPGMTLPTVSWVLLHQSLI